MRKNVLFLSQIVPYPPHGGVLQRGYNLIKEIARYNDIYLLAFVHPEMLATEERISNSMEELKKICTDVSFFPLWPKKSLLHKWTAYALGLIYQKPFSTLAHRSTAFKQKIEEILSSKRVDIVHFDTIGLAPYLPLVQGLPTTLTHHNIESSLMARRAKVEENILKRWYIELQARRLRLYEKQMSGCFDINIMMSERDAAELLSIEPLCSTVIVPNGVDLEYFTMCKDIQENIIIYTGGMNMFANKDAVLHFITDIWPIVKHKVPNARFVVIGQDPPSELLSQSRLDPSIQVLGYVDDIRPYVAKAAVYVVPIRVGGGTRLKVLDALAQGKAIVSTSIGCEGIGVTDGHDILIEDDDKEFALRVIDLLGDQALRNQLGLRARHLAESRYGWESVGVVLQAAYSSLDEKVEEKG
ncbi:glycosyltransferase family 4 protein [Desulfofustis limnaeus]|uniref:Glycosyl transferase family 1 n=1 Tax=Desulfofustis limnaeus TaxID=2740163 RepID=A0ABN6M6R3_9BACT|nr:glycosyltransferase family 4 protein [Desulfofustis limnaeus]BDD87615.1 glycosyl transferase family 1 [Desulfofustis limnaeus]